MIDAAAGRKWRIGGAADVGLANAAGRGIKMRAEG
jgi:hypothetical protein